MQLVMTAAIGKPSVAIQKENVSIVVVACSTLSFATSILDCGGPDFALMKRAAGSFHSDRGDISELRPQCPSSAKVEIQPFCVASQPGQSFRVASFRPGCGLRRVGASPPYGSSVRTTPPDHRRRSRKIPRCRPVAGRRPHHSTLCGAAIPPTMPRPNATECAEAPRLEATQHAYGNHMEEQGIPIFCGIGVRWV
jgi:hypothetical protein